MNQERMSRNMMATHGQNVFLTSSRDIFTGPTQFVRGLGRKSHHGGHRGHREDLPMPAVGSASPHPYRRLYGASRSDPIPARGRRYQRVFTRVDLRMRSSRVINVSPSARAVAAIRRSAGSRGKSGGNSVAAAATSGVMGLTVTPEPSITKRTDASTVPVVSSRPRENIMASSHKVIAATPIP